MPRKLINILCCVVSAILLVVSFPKLDFYFLAWFAFLPLLFTLDNKTFRECFLLSYITGLVFFCGTLYWFIHVTYLGAALLIIYCSLYFGLFGLAYFYAKRFTLIKRTVFLCCAWTVLEFLRSNVISGFGWVSLGYSQYLNLLVIQIADITGVYGVSFLIMLVNITLKEIIVRIRSKGNCYGLVVLNIVILLSVLVYGTIRINERSEGAKMDISIIQANIAQELKWQEPAWEEILETYYILSKQAALDEPEMIIWPETAFPGYLGEHDDVFDELRNFVDSINIPILVGTVVKEGDKYYNSAVLINAQGNIVEQYHKYHLVPFGEYIPFRKLFPFLSTIAPIADFSSGTEFVMFGDDGNKGIFNVLICFEDSVPYLSREFVKGGSQLFINITNDAWFKDTKAPYLHLQSSIFRAIENRRDIVRAANTGISGFIDKRGVIKKLLTDARGKPTYVSGFEQDRVELNTQKTWYSAYGDFFSYAAFLFILYLILRTQIGAKQKEQRK